MRVPAVRLRSGGSRVGVLRGVGVLMFLFRLPAMVMMALCPLVHFVLQDRRWYPGRVIEDELASRATRLPEGRPTPATETRRERVRSPLPILFSRRIRQIANTAKIPKVTSAMVSCFSIASCTASPWAI